MMRRIILIILFSLINAFVFAQNTEWSVTSSKITFKIKNAGFMVDGDIAVIKAKINFDAAKSYSNSIEATVDAKSLTTHNSARDNHIHKPDFFDIEKYPTINLSGSTFSKQPDGSFKGYFRLTIKKTTKDVVIPFTFTEKDNSANFKGAFTINRLDYGVGESSLILSNNVTITIDVNVVKK